MLLNPRATYESWDLRCPSTPTHSYFYHLNPIGVGTPHVESLTGYIARLAREHCVRPRALISREIAPRISKPYYASDRRSLNAFDRAINGLGTTARDFVTTFESLTHSAHLSGTTMLNWKNVTNYRGLIRGSKAWCPCCYRNWSATGKPIYDPLLWSLDAVRICRRHRQWLRLECLQCSRRIDHLVSRPTPGYCSWCGQFLGAPDKTARSSQKTIPKTEWQWQLWTVRNVEKMLAAASRLPSPIPVGHLAQSLELYVDKVFHGQAAKLAERVSKDRSTLNGWLSGALPNLKNLLWICYQLRIPASQFLSLADIGQPLRTLAKDRN